MFSVLTTTGDVAMSAVSGLAEAPVWFSHEL